MEGKTQYSAIEFDILPLTERDRDGVIGFSCGYEELDTFFHCEVFTCAKYCYVSPFCAKGSNGEIIALFTLSNDCIILSSSFDKQDFLDDVAGIVDDEYQAVFGKQSSFPAVNIGHLAVREDLQSKRIGQDILNFVEATFSNYRIAGCQFITVDSLNNPKTNGFYMRNGFQIQTNSDACMPTRRMYLPINLYK